jgi:hypothetical protein
MLVTTLEQRYIAAYKDRVRERDREIETDDQLVWL